MGTNRNSEVPGGGARGLDLGLAMIMQAWGIMCEVDALK
jgi:hypothetical protein